MASQMSIFLGVQVDLAFDAALCHPGLVSYGT